MCYLMLRLQAALQSWGGVATDKYRPTVDFPTMSALIGILEALLGIKRGSLQPFLRIEFAARKDKLWGRKPSILSDFHTIGGTLDPGGAVRKNKVIGYREYLQDTSFTVAIRVLDNSPIDFETLKKALENPTVAVSLGRRSCWPSRPIFEGVVEANSLQDALTKSPFHRFGDILQVRLTDSKNLKEEALKRNLYSIEGLVASCEPLAEDTGYDMTRDVPQGTRLRRRFGLRKVYYYMMEDPTPESIAMEE